MNRFPHLLMEMESLKLYYGIQAEQLRAECDWTRMNVLLTKNACALGLIPLKMALDATARSGLAFLSPWLSTIDNGIGLHFDSIDTLLRRFFGDLGSFPEATYKFLSLFTDPIPEQDWSVEYDTSNVLLDLPGMRLIDISSEGPHRIGNYTVVFAPRAGHHSNIAERVALYMRERGLTRMAIVEQKCADQIPLYVDGKRHLERFEGQLAQYRQILECLKNATGFASHLVAICQPGPLLMSAAIRYPELARTFGSAGSPMDTEAEEGFLTDFARAMGPHYIDVLFSLFGNHIGPDKPGCGRLTYDGAFHVLGFYLLGMEHHIKNFRQLYSDLLSGRNDAAEKQIRFYKWYNFVIHFPEGFIRDTYQKIFVHNQLARGTLIIDGAIVRMSDYPGHIPIWAMGGQRDNIAPAGQAVGHLKRITSVPEADRLSIVCPAGHMGLFRSSQILRTYYPKVVSFLLERSDKAGGQGG